MPRGTRHCITGTLDCTARGYVLHVDGGGCWRLDAWRSLHRYIGQSVTVEGVRLDFDLLEVKQVARRGAAQPIHRRWAMAVRQWIAVLTAKPNQTINGTIDPYEFP